ncbi:MAG: bacteriohopanetetrol glucosamine biosynthesis glycosyltransferase HpnI [Nitrospiraceae bacterium]|nr:bacteriohopanetetrol glucosamine biosynthesis glycosyltransferase HpnI [Nitrospiraceae bacterium]
MPAHEILTGLFLLLIAAGGVYSVLAIISVLMSGREGQAEGQGDAKTALPGVSILKPLMGADEGLKENLASFCRQEYPDYEVLLGLRETGDAAYPVAEEIRRMFPRLVRIVISGEDLGANRKVSNLYGLQENARYDLLAVSDSDMRVGSDYLKTVVSEYQGRADAGLVTSLYRISAPVTAGAALESLTIALDFIPAVLVARRVEGGISFGLGASMLFSRAKFEETGGFRAIADYLADDYQLGNRLWRKGHAIVLSGYVMEDMAGRMGVREHLLHQLRWARTYRASRPKGYLGYGLTHLFAWSLFFFVLLPGSLSLFALALALLLRALTGIAVNRKFIVRGGQGWLKWLFLLPAKDLIGFGIWALSFAGGKVAWRGDVYRVTRTGELRQYHGK